MEKTGNLEIDQIRKGISVFYPKSENVKEFDKISSQSSSKGHQNVNLSHFGRLHI